MSRLVTMTFESTHSLKYTLSLSSEELIFLPTISYKHHSWVLDWQLQWGLIRVTQPRILHVERVLVRQTAASRSKIHRGYIRSDLLSDAKSILPRCYSTLRFWYRGIWYVDEPCHSNDVIILSCTMLYYWRTTSKPCVFLSIVEHESQCRCCSWWLYPSARSSSQMVFDALGLP